MKKEKEKDKEKKKKREKRAEPVAEPKTSQKEAVAEPQAVPAPEPEPKPQPAELPSTKPEICDESALELVMNQVGGKWKLRILWSLRDGKGKRYSSVKGDIPSITDMMLSQSLRELCGDGLIQRNQYQEIPPRVEYQISQEGEGVLPAIQNLIFWAKKRK